MTRISLLALTVATVSAAQTVPERITFSARLQDDGVAVSGTQAVVFNLFDVPTGGVSLWTETHAVPFSVDGICNVELGSLAPLTSTLLDGRKLYIEVTAAGTTLSPRLSVVSVPYAVRATTALEAGRLGTLLPGDVQRRVSGTCPAGQAIRTVDAAGAVVCETVVSTYAGTAPISVSGTNNIGLTPCGPSQLYKMNAAGNAWLCADDVDTNTAYSGAAPVAVSGTSISLATCSANEHLKMNALGTAWQCSSQAAYTPGSGLVLVDTTFSIDDTVVARKDSADTQYFDSSTLVLDYLNNRVGIGTTYPTHQFEVFGGTAAADGPAMGIRMVAQDGAPDGPDSDARGTSGSEVVIFSGSGGPSYWGGNLNLAAGSGGVAVPLNAGGPGGHLNITSGYGGSGTVAQPGGAGGDIVVTAGSGGSGAASALATGGNIQLVSGNGGQSSAAGNIELAGGNSGQAAAGGSVSNRRSQLGGAGRRGDAGGWRLEHRHARLGSARGNHQPGEQRGRQPNRRARRERRPQRDGRWPRRHLEEPRRCRLPAARHHECRGALGDPHHVPLTS